MKMQASRTTTAATSSLRWLPEIGLVDLDDAGLSERRAGKVSEQLEAFAAQMRHGLRAASVAIGLDVVGELIDAEVTEIAGRRAVMTRTEPRTGTAPRTARSPRGGRRVPVRRPRVRTVTDDNGVEREVHLEPYDTFASVELLADLGDSAGAQVEQQRVHATDDPLPLDADVGVPEAGLDRDQGRDRLRIGDVARWVIHGRDLWLLLPDVARGRDLRMDG
jgi:hypothetical protein